VGTDSTLSVSLFATNHFPTIDSIAIVSNTQAIFDTFIVNANRPLPYTLTNPLDTLGLDVSYLARLEQADTAVLRIYHDNDSMDIDLTGTGVEAHPWISPPTIPFKDILIDTPTHFSPVLIGNNGSYPFFVTTILCSDSTFQPSPISPNVPIAPHSTRFDTITFTPVDSRYRTAILQFQTSYHDSSLTVQLSGNGVYAPDAGPDFGFSVASRPEEEPGQLDTIPITITGSRLSKIDTSALTLVVHFDPLMVRVFGATDGEGNAALSFAWPSDSTSAFSIPLRDTVGNIIAYLYTEALLGPHDTSYIHVANSMPAFDRPEAAGDGLFAEFDCGGPVHGVIFTGPYSTGSIVPNPASTSAVLPFQLGLEGPVTVELFNAVGSSVKRVELADVPEGAASLALDISDLPAGTYVYRLTSFDYRSEGQLVILH
jgi:hypothetical protein